ncbi:Zn-binding domain-containing protein [Haloplanus salinarum]|uniref:Zn-binding domain-containing protein n=1 Tax=Haloplanus salinarum TaxID=1912324 RepID=UPI003B43CC2D
MEVLCDRRNLGGLSILSHPQTVNETIFVHDGYTGGAGLTRTAFESLDELLAQVRETITVCGCDGGCPSCIHSPHCGNANRLLEKEWAIRLCTNFLSEWRVRQLPSIEGRRVIECPRRVLFKIDP